MNEWYEFVGNRAISDSFILGKMLGGLLILNFTNTILIVLLFFKNKDGKN